MHSVYISLTTTYKAFSLFFGILSNLVIAAQQVPQSAEFPRQEYWNGLPFPSPGDFPDPGIEPMSLALESRFFNTELPGNPFK